MVDKVIRMILANVACCICGTKSRRVCNECLALDQPACFCDRHENNHKFERFHQAYWEVWQPD